MKRFLALLTISLLALAGTAAAASAQVFFSGAAGGAKVRPASLPLSTDGTLDVGNIHWSSWGASIARGTGVADYHGCTPSCAAGQIHSARVQVILTTPTRCGAKLYYDKVSLREASGAYLDESFLGAENWAPCASH